MLGAIKRMEKVLVLRVERHRAVKFLHSNLELNFLSEDVESHILDKNDEVDIIFICRLYHFAKVMVAVIFLPEHTHQVCSDCIFVLGFDLDSHVRLPVCFLPQLLGHYELAIVYPILPNCEFNKARFLNLKIETFIEFIDCFVCAPFHVFSVVLHVLRAQPGIVKPHKRTRVAILHRLRGTLGIEVQLHFVYRGGVIKSVRVVQRCIAAFILVEEVRADVCACG
jgi:hypothetical protein